MRVTINGVVFEDAPTSDRAYVIGQRGLSGWFGSAGVRREETQRPAAHGSFDAPGYRDAKVPFIRGSIVATSRGELDEMSRRLEGLLADGSVGRMTVQDDTGKVTWQDVRLASPAVVDDFGDGETADFQVGFWSPRAEIYGDMNTYSGSSVTVFHRGTIPAPILVRIPDAPASYTITAPNPAVRTFTVSGATAGGTHEVDLRTGRVTRDGVQMLGVVTRAQTWDMPDGVRWTHTISVGSADWVVPDTYA